MSISFEVPEAILHHLLDPVPLPRMLLIHQELATPAPIGDIGAAVAEQLRRPEVRGLVTSGQRIAIGVGSRGIGRLPEIVAALVAELRSLGAEPFIIPTMGSHGGATADGQREVLAHLGVTEASAGAPIVSQMETAEVGRTADGIAVRLDQQALTADGIVFVGRIKPHTAFRGPYESGLAKMIAIGLGKQAGAAACHAAGFGDMGRRVPLLAEVAIAKAPIRFGLAVLENAHDRPYRLSRRPRRADPGRGAGPAGRGQGRDAAHPVRGDRRAGDRPDRQGYQRRRRRPEHHRGAIPRPSPAAAPASTSRWCWT